MMCLDGTVVGVNMSIADQFNLDDGLGSLTVDADLELEATAELYMDLGLNQTLLLASDHMTITGEADLGGATLVLNLLDDFEPMVGNLFDLFDWSGTLTGMFTAVIVPEGYTFDFTNLYSDGTIALLTSPNTLAGDANGDGQVDGSDVTILADNWQYGVTGTPDATWEMGDFNGDGKVDGSDVTILADNWQAGVATAAAAVPEPSTMAMMLALITFGLIGLRRRIK